MVNYTGYDRFTAHFASYSHRQCHGNGRYGHATFKSTVATSGYGYTTFCTMLLQKLQVPYFKGMTIVNHKTMPLKISPF